MGDTTSPVGSRHFHKRCKQRAGLSRKAADSLLVKALNRGKPAEYYKTRKELYSYLSSLLYDKEYKDLVLYNHYIIIYGKENTNNVGITILDLPKKFYHIVDVVKKKKGDRKHGTNNARNLQENEGYE